MELSRFTDYSLRTLMYAGRHRDRLVTVAEVADAYGVSHHHLVKVVQHLVHRGDLRAWRGRGGGIELAREADEISVGALVRDVESMALVPCLADSQEADRSSRAPARGGRAPLAPSCPLTGACRLQRALTEARAAFVAVLDGYTLADLLRPAAPLRRALGV